jgi:hypothetical protein
MSARNESDAWERFLAARNANLQSIGDMRRLAIGTQASLLKEALKSGQELDVMEYLRTVEDPAVPSDLKVAGLLVDELGSIAAYPGENAPSARAYLETLSKDPGRRDAVLAMADNRIHRCQAEPDDEEIWVYTAEMLRTVDSGRFQAFLQACRTHPSEGIRNIAETFED